MCGVVSHSRESELYASATDRGISAFGPCKVNERVFVGEVGSLSPDLFVLAGYNQILGSKILELPRLGAINLHGGKLPEYRGVAPVNWQIINGETTGGCCVLFVDEGIDTGDLIQQAYYEIGEDDTAQDIVKKQLDLFPQMLLAAVRQIDAGSINRCPQDRKRGAYYIRRYAKDSRIDWRKMSSMQVHNLIRGMRGPSYPPAFCYYRGQKCQVLKSTRLQEDIRGCAGRIALKRGEGMVTIAADRGLLVTEVRFHPFTETQDPRISLHVGENFT